MFACWSCSTSSRCGASCQLALTNEQANSLFYKTETLFVRCTYESMEMTKFTSLKSRVIVLPVDNIDTDQIIPARFLKATTRTALGEALFAAWRRLPAGALPPA